MFNMYTFVPVFARLSRFCELINDKTTLFVGILCIFAIKKNKLIMINQFRRLLLALIFLPLLAQAVIPDIRFRRLDTRDGLSNSQVNCILRDSRGYVWLPTPFGLCRYDGYRFRTFYSFERDTTTLRSNRVTSIMEAYDGRLWLDHGFNYAVYDPITETVERWPTWALAEFGIEGGAENLYIDPETKRFFVKTWDNGYYIYDPATKKLLNIPFGYKDGEFPKDFGIMNYARSKEGMLVVSNLGELLCIDDQRGKVLWKDDYVRRSLHDTYNEYWIYYDKDGITWVITHSTGTYIHVPEDQRWYTSLTELMRAKGFQDVPDDIIVWEVRYDQKGYLWVATDHLGVLLLDFKNKEWRQFTNVKGDETSLPDITAKHLYEDQLGRMWVATYKNGVAMSADAMSNFASLQLGDINAITEDHEGHFWLGLNSGGILKVDPETMEVEERYDKHSIGALNDVIVGSYTAKDGTLWFGTWEGGLISYRNGQWKNYTAATPGSAFMTNNIWGITEDHRGNIWLGVLGGGAVRIDKRTGEQRSWTTKNSTIKTDWTNSIARSAQGWILLGNSEYCTMINPSTMRLINMPLPHDEKSYTISSSTTQALMDHRGLIWQGSASGVNVFDCRTKQSTLLDMKSGFYGNSVVALTEDERGTIWAVTDHGVSNITPKQEDGVWTFAVRSFSDRDGLQPGPFNQRAVYYSKKGLLLIGGQDGLDVINTRKLAGDGKEEKPVFSGLVIYDQLVEAGREYEGHVLLEKALFDTQTLYLKANENHFTIQMASDNGGAKNATRFIYRLEGYNDTWVKTDPLNPNINYMGLPGGSYTLCVRMFKDDGTMGEYESRLDIIIGTPWYRTWWAWLIYLVVAAGILWKLFGHKISAMKERINNQQKTAAPEQPADNETDDKNSTDEEIIDAELMPEDD